MTPIRPTPLPIPLAQTPGALTAQGVEARKAFFRAALDAAQPPAPVARPATAAPEAANRAAAPTEALVSESPAPWGRPGRLVDIRV